MNLKQLAEKYGGIAGEKWRVRKDDGRIYRTLQLEDCNAPVIYVEHKLDKVSLLELFQDMDNLNVVIKENGSCVLYKERWETIDVLKEEEKKNDDATISNKANISTVRIPDFLRRTPKDLKDIQNYIRYSLYYFAYETINMTNFFRFGKELTPQPLQVYKLYLGLENVNDSKFMNLGSLEFTKKTYRNTLGTIYGSLEVKYLFYILSLHIDLDILTIDDIIELGVYLGYSSKNISDFIDQIKVIINSDISSINDAQLLAFKIGLTHPNQRVLPHSLMYTIASVQNWECECSNDDEQDWSGYETMGYWDVDDESYGDAFDDDPEAYWNID